jgi:hypothetical protein
MAVFAFLSPAIASAQGGATPCHATPQESRKQVPWAGNAGEIQWSADQFDCKVDAGAVEWLKISVLPPVSGFGGQRVLRYSVDTNFSPAKREGKVQIGDSAVTIEQAPGPPPGMAYSPSRLEFKITPGKDPSQMGASKALFVGSEEPLVFTATPETTASWISLKTDNPEAPQRQRTFMVSVTAEGKDPGIYQATIQIDAPGAANAKELVPVTMTVERGK